MGITRVSTCYSKSIIDAAIPRLYNRSFNSILSQIVRRVFDRMMIPQQDPTTRTQWVHISDVQINERLCYLAIIGSSIPLSWNEIDLLQKYLFCYRYHFSSLIDTSDILYLLFHHGIQNIPNFLYITSVEQCRLYVRNDILRSHVHVRSISIYVCLLLTTFQ